jgi:hypothetical protein
MTELTADFELADAPVQRLSPLAALFGVLFRPRHTFSVMREAAVGHWWIVPVLTVLVAGLYTVALLPSMAATVEAAAGGGGQVRVETGDSEGAASADQEFQQGNPSQLGMFIGITTFVGAVIGTLFGYLIRAALLFAVGLALGGRASFRQIFRMSVWTTLPDVFRFFVGAMAMFTTGDMTAPGLSGIFTVSELTDVSPLLVAFLSNIDVFTLWSLILIGVGVAVTYQVRPGKAAVITLIYWIIGLIFLMGLSAIGGAFAGATGGPG